MSKNDPNMRLVSDSFGPIEIPADSYYGPQTARSMKHFNINRSHDRMPLPIIHSLAMLKEVAADINCKYARISASHAEAIKKACQEVYSGQLDKEFPLSIWQTGSGTQSNMNVNEVIANRANEILNGNRTDKPQIHPNDHVNCGQSSNDIFPTAMNVSVALETAWKVIPALKTLHSALTEKTEAFSSIVKIGRTHLQDAVPMTVGQELGAFTTQLRQSIDCIKHSLLSVCELAVGGTAVGTGLNSTKGFDKQVCLELNNLVKKLFLDLPTAVSKHAVDLEFVPAENKFAALAGHDTLLQLSSAFNRTATVLFKLADDFILLSSGPGCGFGELLLPPNEPGSSIMPGKVNPTQCEALRMVSLQVMGNHFIVTMAASHGQLQLNVFKPMIGSNILHSCALLTDVAHSFTEHCIRGLQINTSRIEEYVQKSLMLVTALTPHIGYDEAAKLAKYAGQNKLTLKEAAAQLKLVDPEEFDRLVHPRAMAFPHNDDN